MHSIYIYTHTHRSFALCMEQAFSLPREMDSSKVHLGLNPDTRAQPSSLGSEATCSHFPGPAVLAG